MNQQQRFSNPMLDTNKSFGQRNPLIFAQQNTHITPYTQPHNQIVSNTNQQYNGSYQNNHQIMNTTFSPQQPQNTRQNPIIKPQSQYLTAEEIENPWKQKCFGVQQQILELQLKLRDREIPHGVSQEEIENSKIRVLENKVNHLEQMLQERDEQINDRQNRIKTNEMQNSQANAQQIESLSQDVNTWRRRFTDLSNEFNSTQQQLHLTQKDIDTFLKSQ